MFIAIQAIIVYLYIDSQLDVYKWLQVKSCDWESYVSSNGGYQEDFEDLCDVIQNGVAYLSPDLTPQSYYWTNHLNSNSIALNGDECKVVMRVKDPSSEGGLSCYNTRLNIYGQEGYAIVACMMTGCDYYSAIGAGETFVGGNNTDLSDLGQDLQNWHEITLQLENNLVSTYYDGVLKYSLNYVGSVGDLKGLKISFKGSGTIDWVKVKDLNENVIYLEEFDNCICTPGGSVADTIYLNPGWNLISTDVIPQDSTIETVFSILNSGNLVYVSGYNNGASFYDPNGLPFLNTLNDITRGYGYWVKVNDADTLIVTGEPIDPDYRIDFNPNWRSGRISSSDSTGIRKIISQI
ncbi:MAG: hypothetical protein R2771_14290 [Saprospiraceae bacterium]